MVPPTIFVPHPLDDALCCSEDRQARAAPHDGRCCSHREAALLQAVSGVTRGGVRWCYKRRPVFLLTVAGVVLDSERRCSQWQAVLLHKVAVVATHGSRRCSRRGAALLHKVSELLSTGSGVATQGGMCCSQCGAVLLQRSTSELQAPPRVLQIRTARATIADASAVAETASTYSREAPRMLQAHGSAADLFHWRRCDSGGAVFSGDMSPATRSFCGDGGGAGAAVEFQVAAWLVVGGWGWRIFCV
jgi:hypothetical protein